MSSNFSADKMRSVIAAVRSTGVNLAPRGDFHGWQSGLSPFVTISREAGAGGWSLAQRLVERLNAQDEAGPRWQAYDRELVEKIAADHNLPTELIEKFGESTTSWIDDLFAGLELVNNKEETRNDLALYRLVARMILALAQNGRVVIVGRGGINITRHLPGGVHLRLVAPLDHRVAEMGRKFNLSPAAAALRIRELDRNRDAFRRRYWPQETAHNEAFTLTINMAQVSEEQAVHVILPLVPSAKRTKAALGQVDAIVNSVEVYED